MRGNSGLYIPFATHDLLTVVITYPANGQAVTDAQMRVQWTTSTIDVQATYRLRIFSDAALANVVYDSGVISSAAQQASIQLAGLLSASTNYWIVVDVTDTFGLSGTSNSVQFSTSWATSVNISGARFTTIGGCTDPRGLPGIRLQWTQVVPGTGETFVRYEVYRRDPLTETNYTRMAMITTATTVFFEDYEIESGRVYQYYVVWLASVGIETRISAIPTTKINGLNSWDHLWIHALTAPTSYNCRFDSFEMSMDVQQQIAFQRTWGSQQPVMRIGDQQYKHVTVPALPQELSYRQAWDQILALITRQRTNANILVARWGKGREMIYCNIASSSKVQHQGDYDRSIELVEVRHKLGV